MKPCAEVVIKVLLILFVITGNGRCIDVSYGDIAGDGGVFIKDGDHVQIIFRNKYCPECERETHPCTEILLSSGLPYEKSEMCERCGKRPKVADSRISGVQLGKGITCDKCGKTHVYEIEEIFAFGTKCYKLGEHIYICFKKKLCMSCATKLSPCIKVRTSEVPEPVENTILCDECEKNLELPNFITGNAKEETALTITIICDSCGKLHQFSKRKIETILGNRPKVMGRVYVPQTNSIPKNVYSVGRRRVLQQTNTQQESQSSTNPQQNP